MADPFTAEIRAFGFNFAPVNWAYCNGQQIQVQQNSTLFALLGANFGGNGTTNFNLPDLRGQTPVDVGNGPGLTPRSVGETLGSATVVLTEATMPAHSHAIVADVVATTAQVQLTPLTTSLIARNVGEQIYSDAAGTAAAMDPRMIGMAGGTQPHANMQPYQVLNFCICLYGEWPPHP